MSLFFTVSARTDEFDLKDFLESALLCEIEFLREETEWDLMDDFMDAYLLDGVELVMICGFSWDLDCDD